MAVKSYPTTISDTLALLQKGCDRLDNNRQVFGDFPFVTAVRKVCALLEFIKDFTRCDDLVAAQSQLTEYAKLGEFSDLRDLVRDKSLGILLRNTSGNYIDSQKLCETLNDMKADASVPDMYNNGYRAAVSAISQYVHILQSTAILQYMSVEEALHILNCEAECAKRRDAGCREACESCDILRPANAVTYAALQVAIRSLGGSQATPD